MMQLIFLTCDRPFALGHDRVSNVSHSFVQFLQSQFLLSILWQNLVCVQRGLTKRNDFINSAYVKVFSFFAAFCVYLHTLLLKFTDLHCKNEARKSKIMLHIYSLGWVLSFWNWESGFGEWFFAPLGRFTMDRSCCWLGSKTNKMKLLKEICI